VSAMDGWRTLARGIGQTLITIGLVLLLFVAYELWGTGLYTKAEQNHLEQQITHRWDSSGGTPDITRIKNVPIGSGLAVLRIPRFGSGYHMVVVEGTGYDDLRRGPGHYPGTAMPGQVGNFAVAGHRTTYLAPFNNIDRLQPGDAIVLETRDRWYTYTVRDMPTTPGYPAVPYQEIVDPTRVEVAYAVPDQPDPAAKPSLRMLTFTSCNPKYSAAQRIVVHALLTDTMQKSGDQLPPALAGG
jgi:sortase A